MKHPKSFRIRAENVPLQGLEIKEKLESSYVSQLIEEPKGLLSWTCEGDVSLVCRLEHEADMLHLRGGGVFNVVHPCVRCTEDVRFQIKVDFNSRLLPRDSSEDDGEIEFDSETFEADSNESVVCYYDDGIIDLSDLLREQLFLEFPLYPSCEDPESQDPKECDMSILVTINMPSANVIEHPFSGLRNWKPKGV
jgi:uncharacterized metal-binding protein YceD (DUF177 family)